MNNILTKLKIVTVRPNSLFVIKPTSKTDCINCIVHKDDLIENHVFEPAIVSRIFLDMHSENILNLRYFRIETI